MRIPLSASASAIAGMTLILLSCSALAGCSGKIEMVAVAAGTSEKSAAKGSDKQIQSFKERRLVVLFRGLLQMDKKKELVITPDQAQRMLPIVLKSIEAGTISGTDYTGITLLLDKEQQLFIEETAERFRKLKDEPAEPGNRPKDVSPEERTQMVEALKSRRNQEGAEGAKEEDKINNRAPANKLTKPGPSATPPPKGVPYKELDLTEMNIEQQVIDLLQSKIGNAK